MAHLDSSISFKGLISDSSRYQTEVSECSSHSSNYWRVKLLGIKELEALLSVYRLRTEKIEEQQKHQET